MQTPLSADLYKAVSSCSTERVQVIMKYRKKLLKIRNGNHVPNKKESQLLRKLKSQTGLSEEAIRSIYKYRKMLSEAARCPFNPKAHMLRMVRGIIKNTRLNFHPRHPESVVKIENYLNGRPWWPRPLPDELKELNAESLVNLYERLKREKNKAKALKS